MQSYVKRAGKWEIRTPIQLGNYLQWNLKYRIGTTFRDSSVFTSLYRTGTVL